MNTDLDGCLSESRRRDRMDGHSISINVRNNLERFDVSAVDGLQPHGLPNAAGRCVPNAVRFAHLFATRLGAGVRGVPGRNDDFIWPLLVNSLREVADESVVTSAMLAHLLAIDPNCG